MSEGNNKYQLSERTLLFSVRIIKHCSRLKQPILRSVVDQLVRSATSVGADYAEANNAASRTDFRAKIFIAKKECAETKYWLSLLIALGDHTDEAKGLEEEAQGILMTLQKIINTMRDSENGKLTTQGKPKTAN